MTDMECCGSIHESLHNPGCIYWAHNSITVTPEEIKMVHPDYPTPILVVNQWCEQHTQAIADYFGSKK